MKNKTIIIYALIVLFILVMGGIFVTYASNKQEPIQKILNQIEANESELQQIETRADELNRENEEAKSRLLNEYGLELSKAFTKNVEQKAETDLSALIYDENGNCIGGIGCGPNDRTPGKLSEDGTRQEMPEIKATDEHERFKELATAYGLDASTIWSVENHYGIKEGVILCITVAETSGGNRGYGSKNIGSVGSNDRGDRPTYALMEAGLEAIGKTLNNQYLGSKKTLGCLSNAGSCNESNDNGKRYATSESSREKNMVACLSTIYGNLNASTFGIRR